MNILDRLDEFARKHYAAFMIFNESVSKNFFLALKDTTQIRFDEKGEITGFVVWKELEDRIVFMGAALIGDRKENYKAMREFLKKFKKPIYLGKRCGNYLQLRQ